MPERGNDNNTPDASDKSTTATSGSTGLRPRAAAAAGHAKHPSGGDTMWSVRSSRVYPRTVCANVCSAFRWCTLLTSKFYPLFKGRRVRDFPGTILIECSHAILMEETTANDAMAYRSPPRPHVVDNSAICRGRLHRRRRRHRPPDHRYRSRTRPSATRARVAVGRTVRRSRVRLSLCFVVAARRTWYMVVWYVLHTSYGGTTAALVSRIPSSSSRSIRPRRAPNGGLWAAITVVVPACPGPKARVPRGAPGPSSGAWTTTLSHPVKTFSLFSLVHPSVALRGSGFPTTCYFSYDRLLVFIVPSDRWPHCPVGFSKRNNIVLSQIRNSSRPR